MLGSCIAQSPAGRVDHPEQSQWHWLARVLGEWVGLSQDHHQRALLGLESVPPLRPGRGANS